MNYLMCSVGRRGELLKYFRKSISMDSRIVATDNSPYAPALYFADSKYIVPRINDERYIDFILKICRNEKIDAVTTLIDPEIELLAKNRNMFDKIGVELLVPYELTAHICYDKYEMYKYLREKGIPTVQTWNSIEDFDEAISNKEVSFPVFIKPRTGSGSVGAERIDNYEQLQTAMYAESSLIIQEYMECDDIDADVYVDTITHKAVSVFSKKKIESRIGGASKTISFKDSKLFELIQQIIDNLEFNGPIDMDFFYKDGIYYLSEINPRFGGAYLHAYGAGVDFIKLIENNLQGRINEPRYDEYEEGIVMMMYDSVVICKPNEIVN